MKEQKETPSILKKKKKRGKNKECGLVSQGPVNAITLWSVPPNQRPFACAMGTVAIHLFGDVPSPPLLGKLQDWLQDWRTSVSILNTLLLVGAAVWLRGEKSQVSVMGIERWKTCPPHHCWSGCKFGIR
jgi:hypothetical protein